MGIHLDRAHATDEDSRPLPLSFVLTFWFSTLVVVGVAWFAHRGTDVGWAGATTGFLAALIAQRFAWLCIWDIGRPSRHPGRVVRFLETLRQYLADDPSDADDVEEMGRTGAGVGAGASR